MESSNPDAESRENFAPVPVVISDTPSKPEMDLTGPSAFLSSNVNGHRGSGVDLVEALDMPHSNDGEFFSPEKTFSKPDDRSLYHDSLSANSESSADPVKSHSEAVTEVLASADMNDSLDIEYAMSLANNAESPKNRTTESWEIAAGGGGKLTGPKDYMEYMNKATANEIFSDGGLNFLENAGSAPQDSELARQSLYRNFDPFVKSASVPRQVPSDITGSPGGPMGPPGGVPRQPYSAPSHTATTQMLAAMQQKQNMIQRQKLQQTQALPEFKAPFPVHNFHGEDTPLPQQPPSSWPDVVTHRDAPPFTNMKTAPFVAQNQPQPSPAAEFRLPTTPVPEKVPVPLDVGNFSHEGMNGDVMQTDLESPVPSYPPGSLVNLGDSPQRPVTLRPKGQKTVSHTKTFNRKSMPASMFDDPEAGLFAGLPDLPPVWENVVSTYEGIVQTLLAKLKSYQEEAAAARQREARALADQEELHKVFVNLHERYEASKNVIQSFKSNQDTLQKAFDELNGEFQPLMQEMKRVQASNKLNEIKTRQMEAELEKRKEENAELTKIVDDLISKDT